MWPHPRVKRDFLTPSKVSKIWGWIQRGIGSGPETHFGREFTVNFEVWADMLHKQIRFIRKFTCKRHAHGTPRCDLHVNLRLKSHFSVRRFFHVNSREKCKSTKKRILNVNLRDFRLKKGAKKSRCVFLARVFTAKTQLGPSATQLASRFSYTHNYPCTK